MRYICTSMMAILVLNGTSIAATINVPGDYPTIQDAIDAAVTGDAIVVAPGTWTGPGDSVIDFIGKAITVQSSNGPMTTIIDGQNARRGVLFSGGETGDTILKGFTIRNGLATDSLSQGGGILGDFNASPSIIDCVITDNTAWLGPGIMMRGDANISGCEVSGNNAHDNASPNSYGGGIYCLGDAVMTNCQISNNGSYWGAGVTFHDSDGHLINCTLIGNNAVQGGAVYVRNQSPLVDGCNLHGNHASYGGAIYMFTDSSPSFLNCSIQDNVASGFAGAVAAYLHGAARFENCTVTNNQSDGNSGAFWAYGSSAEMEIMNCMITSNLCAGTGGAIYSDLALITMSDTLVCENTLDQLVGPWVDGGGNTITERCQTGACCNGADCSLLTQVECDAIAGSTWLGDGSTCDACLTPDKGACCLVDELRGSSNCVLTDPVQCQNLGGDWQGSGSDCTACIPPPQQGGCCLGSGCILLWEDECLSAEGNWLGNDVDCSNCPETGACCLCNGCLVMIEQDCASAGGDWLINSTCDTCPPASDVGACCLASGCISSASEDDCITNLGEWLGPNGACVDCPQPCFGDLNGDWIVDVDDLLILLGSFGFCP